MWLGLLARFWKPLAGILIAAVVVGLIYRQGRLAERAVWEPKFAAAEKAKAEADARAEAKESLARRLSAESDTRYADTIFRLNERAVDASRDIRQLVRLISASRQQVSADGTAPRGPDANSAGDGRLETVGVDLAELARRCESDAHQLAELQRYVSGQLAALN